jgi:transcriptional regulator with XRE-family HTH domain
LKRTKLIEARRTRHKTQQQIADALGVDADTVSRWEQGKTVPRGYHIEELCQFYGMSEGELGLLDSEDVPCVILEQPGATMRDLLSSIQEDLTTRLVAIVASWSRRNHNYSELQGQITTAIDDYNVFIEQDDDFILSRRRALKTIAQLPIAFCGLGLGITLSAAPLKRSAEDILTYCAAGISACWHFRKGRDLALAYEAITAYISMLNGITSSSSEQHRKSAAALMTQSYLLKASLAGHLESNDRAITYHKEALRFAQMAESPLLQAVAWRTLSTTYIYADRWDQALFASTQARKLIEQPKDIPGSLQSYIHANIAMTQAHQGQHDEAMTSLKAAHATFDPGDQLPVWVLYGSAVLASCDGVTHHNLGSYKKAIDSFEQIPALPAVSELGKVEATFDLLGSEVSRDDQPRDRDRCVELFIQGIKGTKELRSERRFAEARNVLQLMFVAWPGEPRVRELRDLAVHW